MAGCPGRGAKASCLLREAAAPRLVGAMEFAELSHSVMVDALFLPKKWGLQGDVSDFPLE